MALLKKLVFDLPPKTEQGPLRTPAQ